METMDTNRNTTQDMVNERLIEERQTASEMEGKYLTFITDNQLFGVPISDVVQIVGIQAITQIPEFPSYAKGVIDLRGSIISLIDVRLRLGKEEREYDERTCIIVTSINDLAVGFIVDEVDAVTNIDSENISAPPRLSSDWASLFLTGVARVEEKVVLLISASKLLSEDTVSLIAKVQE